MSQQFLERKALLAGMIAGLQAGKVCIRWRFMEILKCLCERWHRQLFKDVRRQQLLGRAGAHLLQRLQYQSAQPSLLHALRDGVNRRQAIADRYVLVGTQQSVLGVDHLDAGRPMPHVTETYNLAAFTKLRLLLSGEVEKSQGHLTAAVRDSHQQLTSAPEGDLGEQNFAADKAALSGNGATNRRQTGSVLVPEGQQWILLENSHHFCLVHFHPLSVEWDETRNATVIVK